MAAQKPKSGRWVSPEERAWLRRINRQMAYDERMQRKREHWLWIRPPKGKTR